MNKPAVATPSDYRDVVEVLATAFAQDGVFSALLPDARSRTARLRRFFEIDASPWALEHGHSWILRDGREPLGAAVILASKLLIVAANSSITMRIASRSPASYARSSKIVV